MAATSALVTGSDFGRKLVGDAVQPLCCPSQCGAPELTLASFLLPVFLHKIKHWKVQLICHNVIAPWPLASIKWAQNQEKSYFSYSKLVSYASFTCKCASHIKMLLLP